MYNQYGEIGAAEYDGQPRLGTGHCLVGSEMALFGHTLFS